MKNKNEININEVLHVKLKQLMKDKAITQDALSAMIGIAQPQLSNYVSGKTVPRLGILIKIAQALDVTLDEFTHL